MAHDVRSPHIFVDGPGNTASGDQVMDNFDALWTARDVLAQPGRATDGGKFVQGSSGSRTNVAYGALSNGPDVVTGVVLPPDGVIVVIYRAFWQESVSGAGRAAIFLGASQVLRQATAAAGAFAQEADIGGTANSNQFLVSHPGGLATAVGAAVPTTVPGAAPQIIGVFPDNVDTSAGWAGPVYIEAPAGTYDVSVQFKSTSGSVTASNRKLLVSAHDFS